MKKRILIVLLLLFLTACTKHLEEGIVIEKHFEEAHTVYLPTVIIINKVTRIIPRWISYDDRWYIIVQQDEKRDSWDVSEEVYDSVEIGDYVKREDV